MYTSLLSDADDLVGSIDASADTPNIGLMLGAALLAFVLAAFAVPGLIAGLNAVTEGRWLWPAIGLLAWIGLVVLAAKLAQAYGDQVERAPIDLLTAFGNGVAGILYAAAILAGLLLGWRARTSLRAY